MKAAGSLRIVPSNDLGALGPTEGQSISYHWRWYYSVPSLSLWVVLMIATVLPRANRRPGVLLMVAPAAVAYGGWLAILNRVLPPIASQDNSISTIVLSLAIGSALLWLIGHLLAGGTWRRTLIGASSIVTGIAVLTTLSFRFELSAYTVSMMGGLAIPMLAMVAGYAVAGRSSRRSYRRAVFAFWLAAGTLIPAVAGGVVFMVLQSAFIGVWPGNVGLTLGFGALLGLILGVMALVISLPFLLIGTHIAMFRQRLWSCLRLASAPVAVENATGAQVQTAACESRPFPDP